METITPAPDLRAQPAANRSASTGLGQLRVQCIVYELPPDKALRTAEYVDCAVGHALAAGLISGASLAFGDCSPSPAFLDSELAVAKTQFAHLTDVTTTNFGENLGHGGGQNRLLAASGSDLTLILNPDILVAPTLLIELMGALQRPGVGLVEARQLPSEHPKDFDPTTGSTSWGSGACLLAKTSVLRELGGFDADTFFLYCDDVDLSWRARLAGYDVVYQPTAVCFHDKRLSDKAGWIAGPAERYYSAEAGLLLAHKYSRPDLCDKYLKVFRASRDTNLLKAAKEFDTRKSQGRLPTPIDAGHTVAQFIDGGYAKHRFHAR